MLFVILVDIFSFFLLSYFIFIILLIVSFNIVFWFFIVIILILVWLGLIGICFLRNWVKLVI